MGRLKYGKSDASLYSFEMSVGNSYGIIGAIVYAVIRSIAFIFIALNVASAFAKSAWRNSAVSRNEVKSSLGDNLITIMLLVLMPYIFDLAIYVRDLILNAIRAGISKVIPGSISMTMWEGLSNSYALQSSKSIILALLLSNIYKIFPSS